MSSTISSQSTLALSPSITNGSTPGKEQRSVTPSAAQQPAAIAASDFSSSTVYAPPRQANATQPAADTPGATSPITPLLAQLQQSQAHYDQLADGQPSFFTFTHNWLSKRLQDDFSITEPTLYLNRYADVNGQRQLVSAKSLLSVFREAIVTGKVPAFDKQTVEISTSPGNAKDASALPSLSSQPALDKLEQALYQGARDFPDIFRREQRNYWSNPQGTETATTRKGALATEMSHALRAEAELRHQDGTLDDTSYRMLLSATRQAGESSPAQTPVHAAIVSLSYKDPVDGFKTAHMPGVRVLTERPLGSRTADGKNFDFGKIVLLVPGGGIKTFDNEDSLKQALLETFAPGAHEPVNTAWVQQGSDFMTSRAQELLDDSDKRWVQALARVRSRPLANGEVTMAGQQLDRAGDMAPSMDTHGALEDRNAALVAQAMPDWLRNAPREKKHAWADAMRSYLRVLKSTDHVDAKSMGSPEAVRKYAHDRLLTALKREHGIVGDPDRIKITRTWYETTTTGDPRFKKIVTKTETKTLTELGLTNISWFDQFHLPGNAPKVTDDKGQPIAGLDWSKIQHIVQNADVGGSYDEALKHKITEKNQRDYARILDAGMRVQLLESQLQKPLSKRGEAMVQAALDSPEPIGRARVSGRTVTVGEMILNDATVNGSKLFETSPTYDGTLVLYLPGAPDGRSFREYSSRAAMLRDLKSTPQMCQYITQHVARNRADGVASVLNSQHRGHIQTAKYRGNFLRQSYNADVKLARVNADAQTTSNNEMFWQDVKGGIQFTYELASIFMPIKLTLPIALMRSLYSAGNAVKALEQNHQQEALSHATDALMTMIFDAVGEGAAYRMSRRTLTPVLRKGVGKSLDNAASSRVTMQLDATPATQFAPDPSLRAFEQKQLDASKLQATDNGIYLQPGKHEEYVKIGDKWYASADDNGRRFIYMPDAEGPSATWPIHKQGDQWQFSRLDELPGRPLPIEARIPARYRVDPPADLSDADAHGVYRSKGQDYIKIDGLLYRTGQGTRGRYIHDGNPTHRILVQRDGHTWKITPPSFGRGGGRVDPVDVVKEVFNMSDAEARAYLKLYQFEDQGLYTELNFVRALSDTMQVPHWAAQFKRPMTPSANDGAIAGSSKAPSTSATTAASATDVINPVSGKLVHIPAGGYLNQHGFIERTDVPHLYRAMLSNVARRHDPRWEGFRPSREFNAIDNMFGDSAVITSMHADGPRHVFGHHYLDDVYSQYEIDARGLRVVSLRENMLHNPDRMDDMLGLPPGTVSNILSIPDEALRRRRLNQVTTGTFDVDEAHVDSLDLGLGTRRVNFYDGIHPDLLSPSSGSSSGSSSPASPSSP